MNCVMTRGVYLRYDGRLPCYCSAGETVTLGRLPQDGSSFRFVEDYYRSPLFRRIRESMSRDMVPFPGVCDQCTYLDVHEAYRGDLLDSSLAWFHFEPSYNCNLKCQWCDGQRTGAAAPWGYNLPFELFAGVVNDMAAQGISLEKGNICGVGEPTMNPNVWKMVRLVREKLGGDILLSTNGNGPYSPDIVTSGLNKIKIAIDGVTQDVYKRYRKNGQISRVIDFISRITADRERLGSAYPKIIWQYILFNYNDSDKELAQLQKMARDIGVDMLRIVYTRCDNYSTRHPDDFPVDFPDILFFPIKDESLLAVEDAQHTLERIAERMDESPAGAALECIALANGVHHRLALGVRNYKELLSFVSLTHKLDDANAGALTLGEYEALQDVRAQCYGMLAQLYERLGEKSQAEAYARLNQRNGQ